MGGAHPDSNAEGVPPYRPLMEKKCAPMARQLNYKSTVSYAPGSVNKGRGGEYISFCFKSL